MCWWEYVERLCGPVDCVYLGLIYGCVYGCCVGIWSIWGVGEIWCVWRVLLGVWGPYGCIWVLRFFRVVLLICVFALWWIRYPAWTYRTPWIPRSLGPPVPRSLVPLDPRSLVPSFPWTPGPSFPPYIYTYVTSTRRLKLYTTTSTIVHAAPYLRNIQWTHQAPIQEINYRDNLRDNNTHNTTAPSLWPGVLLHQMLVMCSRGQSPRCVSVISLGRTYSICSFLCWWLWVVSKLHLDFYTFLYRNVSKKFPRLAMFNVIHV
jgi:hypothetical protein